MRLLRTIFLFIAATAISCSSDPSAPTSAFKNSADAKAEENTKSGGIYKGVIAGSSGFVVVVLQSGLKEIRLTLNNEKRTFTSTDLDGWVSGEPIKNAVFIAGDWSVTFSVGAAGNVPSLTLSIPGHPGAQAVIVKELSTDVVRAYEGTYSGTESGTWNFVLQGPVLIGVSRTTDGSGSTLLYGFVNENSITLQPPVTGSGTISIDNVSGTWESDTPASGTWTGKRVL
jgi:hypothetical protein